MNFQIDSHLMHTVPTVLFSFNATPTTKIYPLSLHDALPIYRPASVAPRAVVAGRVVVPEPGLPLPGDRKSTRLNSSHVEISYAVFCLKKKIKRKALPIRLLPRRTSCLRGSPLAPSPPRRGCR